MNGASISRLTHPRHSLGYRGVCSWLVETKWRERIPDAEDLNFDAVKARAAGSSLIQVVEVLPVLFGELLGNPNEDEDFQNLPLRPRAGMSRR